MDFLFSAFYLSNNIKAGCYIYVSINSILDKALNTLGLAKFPHEEISSDCRDILKIYSGGKLTRSHFQYNDYPYYRCWGGRAIDEQVMLNRLNQCAERCWIDEFYIDLLLDYGYTIEEVEDLICVPNAIETAVNEILGEFDYCEEW